MASYSWHQQQAETRIYDLFMCDSFIWLIHHCPAIKVELCVMIEWYYFIALRIHYFSIARLVFHKRRTFHTVTRAWSQHLNIPALITVPGTRRYKNIGRCNMSKYLQFHLDDRRCWFIKLPCKWKKKPLEMLNINPGTLSSLFCLTVKT